MAAAKEKYTQDGRILKLMTPLGKDFLLIDSIEGSEAISGLFRFELAVRHQEKSETGPPTVVKPSDILGQAVTVELYLDDNSTKRHFNGIVNRLTQGGRDAEFTLYRLEVVPHFWLLTQSQHSRIFQQQSVEDILKKVLKGIQIRIQLQRKYEPKNYCVQYRESDFAFASRIMEEEGIFYYFEHTADSHTMIIADSPDCHKPCPSTTSIDFVASSTGDLKVPIVYEWSLDYQLQAGKIEYWDHQFQLPNKKLEAPKPSRITNVNNKDVEFYDYPGIYAKRFDGIDKGGGEQSGNLQKVFEENIQVAQSAIDALDAKYKTYRGWSDCASFIAGHKIKINSLPISEDNGEYTLTSVTVHCEQSPDYGSSDPNPSLFRNQFECIPMGKAEFPPFRPQQTTPKPVVRGSQTGYVVGPGGEEIFTDKYGRVKVQLHWDREGQNNAGSSCWMRVAQGWSGKQWGAMHIPRIGAEVVVHFLEGDPDQPIVAGCLYNPDTMPAYTLPDHKTRSYIKTNSSPGGKGSNELRFEDKAGSEQIFIHAEKNQDIRVKNECAESVGSNRSLTVGGDQMEKVSGDKHLEITGNQNEKIGSSYSHKVGTNVDQKVGLKYAVDSGTEIHLKAGMKVVIEAGVQLSLKGPGGFIDIGPAGVTIQGTMVLINSGGGAGAGSGTSPTAPKAPKEADNSESGQKLSPPPAKPAHQSPGAGALSGAAGSGQPLANTGAGGAGAGGGAAGGAPAGAGAGAGGGAADAASGGAAGGNAADSGSGQAGQGGSGSGGGGAAGGNPADSGSGQAGQGGSGSGGGGAAGGNPADSGSGGAGQTGGGGGGGNTSPGGGSGGGGGGGGNPPGSGGSPQTQGGGSGGSGGQSGGGYPPDSGSGGGGGSGGSGGSGGQSGGGGSSSPGGGSGGGGGGNPPGSGGSPQTQGDGGSKFSDGGGGTKSGDGGGKFSDGGGGTKSGGGGGGNVW